MNTQHFAAGLAFYFLLAFLPGQHCLAEEKITLWSINPGTSFASLTDQAAQDFSQSLDGFHLESVHFDNNFYKFKLKAAIEAHEAPDIFHNWGENSIQSYVRSGKIAALDDIEDKLEQFFLPLALKPVTFDNTVYGIPYNGLTGVFFWYRKDVFAKHNLQPPTTWQEFIAVGETLKKNGVIPIALANKNKWPGSFYYMYLVDRLGGPQLFHDAYSSQNNQSFLHPAFITAGIMIQDLVTREFFPQGFNQLRDEPGNWNSLLISGKAGMYLMGSWFFGVISDLPPAEKEQFDFFPFPAVEGGLGNPDDLVGSPGQDYLSVSADSKHPAAAMAFLGNHICSDNYFRSLANLGFVPPTKNADLYLSDPLAKKVALAFRKAENVQIYYDQVMPATLAEAHKLLIHQLFELQIKPVQAAQYHEKLVQSHHKSQ